MVHKKYIKRGDKKYGPYIYETKRVNGRVVTTYLGKEGEFEKKENKLTYNLSFNFRFLLVILLFVLLVFGFFYLLEEKQYGFIVGQRGLTQLIVTFNSPVFLKDITGLPQGTVIESVKLVGEEIPIKEEPIVPE